MEIPSNLFIPLPLILFILSFLFILLNTYRSELPPGPFKLPFVGSIHQLLKAGEFAHHKFYRLAQKYGPLFHIQLGQVIFVVISDHITAREVLSIQDQTFAYRPSMLAVDIIGYNSSGIGFSPYGPYWRQLRRLCTQEILSVKKVKSLGFIRSEVVLKLIDKIRTEGGSPINLTKMLQEVNNEVIFRASFGRVRIKESRFLLAMKEVLELLPMLRLVDLFPSVGHVLSFVDGSRSEMKRLRGELDAILDEIIEEHRKSLPVEDEGDEDFVDLLIRIQEKGELEVPLTMDNVKAVILDMLLGATETSTSMMCWVISELVCHNEIMELAQIEVRKALKGRTKLEEIDFKEFPYLHMIIKETLRLHPPLPLLLPRTCNKATKLLGFTIPAKTQVVVNAWAIARDPNVWKDPQLFCPERFEGNTPNFKDNNYEYIPFGSGRRICPGITFALAEMELFLTLLLAHFDWKLPCENGHEKLDMEEDFDGTARRKIDLCLIAVPHDI